MLSRINFIFLFVVLAGTNAAPAATLCAGSSDQKDGHLPQNHCKIARTTATPMSCRQQTPVLHPEQTSMGARGCCQMSAPLPDQPRPALPGNSREEFRLQIQSQLFDSSEPISPSALAPLLPGWVFSMMAFLPGSF